MAELLGDGLRVLLLTLFYEGTSKYDLVHAVIKAALIKVVVVALLRGQSTQ